MVLIVDEGGKGSKIPISLVDVDPVFVDNVDIINGIPIVREAAGFTFGIPGEDDDVQFQSQLYAVDGLTVQQIKAGITKADIFERPQKLLLLRAQKQYERFKHRLKDKAYYKKFSLRELAYIYNSGEITSKYAKSIITANTKNPLDYSGRIAKYTEYRRRGTVFTSDEIDDVVKTYRNLSMEDFADMVNNKGYEMDKALYIMFRLGIYDTDDWHDLTGYLGKGARFLPTVAGNVGDVFGFIGDSIGNTLGFITDKVVSPALAGFLEGLFGKDWKKKLILFGSIAIAAIIGILILYFYSKTYITTKAKKRAE